jgi:hypothetical protein
MGSVIRYIAFSACTPCRFSPSAVQPFNDSTIFQTFRVTNRRIPRSTSVKREAPEMTSSKQAVKEGHNNKRKLNNE